ncbi:ferredoxin-thioredoxin reductase subunit A2, chloroplastic-like [Malania oleifera]|uniref:ferredoxin-thioredoxin reductase subunit A2, chloroplastic-like n=1 Tax=Malania oleifera TaxID=397392 RepID=UPI0025ADE059|nr:ferredoxin-thioredoxin reductase subunit A2, chloroplastic-like [Malania oleifera]
MTSSPLALALGPPRPLVCSSTSPLNGRNDVVGVLPLKPAALSAFSLADGRTTIPTAAARKSNTVAGRRRRRTIQCEAALRSDSATSVDDSASISASVSVEDEDLSTATAGVGKVGARVRVKVPLKVFHVPRVPEVDLAGMEGKVKQYVGLWKGKRISANLPFKVEFVTEIEGRGPVKFFAHLKEDEFEYVHST